MDYKPVIFLAFANANLQTVPEAYLHNLNKESGDLYRALQLRHDGNFLQIHREEQVDRDKIFHAFAHYAGKIQIFHFAGHADGEHLFLLDDEQEQQAALAKGLADLFGQHQQSLKLVFLNGCSTYGQVKMLLDNHVPAVIATSTTISDRMAGIFAEQFYTNLAGGQSINQAYEAAKAWFSTTGEQKIFDQDQARSIGRKKKGENRDILPWGLYTLEENCPALNWKIPDVPFAPELGIQADVLRGLIRANPNVIAGLVNGNLHHTPAPQPETSAVAPLSREEKKSKAVALLKELNFSDQKKAFRFLYKHINFHTQNKGLSLLIKAEPEHAPEWLLKICLKEVWKDPDGISLRPSKMDLESLGINHNIEGFLYALMDTLEAEEMDDIDFESVCEEIAYFLEDGPLILQIKHAELLPADFVEKFWTPLSQYLDEQSLPHKLYIFLIDEQEGAANNLSRFLSMEDAYGSDNIDLPVSFSNISPINQQEIYSWGEEHQDIIRQLQPDFNFEFDTQLYSFSKKLFNETHGIPKTVLKEIYIQLVGTRKCRYETDLVARLD